MVKGPESRFPRDYPVKIGNGCGRHAWGSLFRSCKEWRKDSVEASVGRVGVVYVKIQET